MSGTARTAGLFSVTAACAARAELFQHHFQRAEIRERRLQQVEAYERGEPEPVRVVVMRQQQAGEDKRAGEPANEHVHFHIPIPSRQLQKGYKPIVRVVEEDGLTGEIT